MLDIKSMDLSVLDALKALKTEREALEARLAQMEARKHEVAPPIYLRVRSDYETQKQTLVAKEAPLRQKATALYAEVRQHIDDVENRFDEATLALQELEFRHSLGEFNEQVFNERKQSISENLAAQDFAKAEAETLRARFVDAFGSEAALELATPVALPASSKAAPPIMPSPATPPPVNAPVMPAPMPAAAAPPVPFAPPIPPATMLGTAILQLDAATPIPPPIPFDDLPPSPIKPAPIDMTPIAIAPAPPTPVPPTINPVPAAPGASQTASASASPSSSPVKRVNPDATVMFRPGKLLPVNADAGSMATTLSLKPIVIGSDASCDVRLAGASISAKHAEISLSRNGFVVKAMDVNPFSINGIECREQLLKDGDTLQVGTARFSFKT